VYQTLLMHNVTELCLWSWPVIWEYFISSSSRPHCSNSAIISVIRDDAQIISCC